MAFFHIFGNLGRIGFFRHGLEKSLLLRFALPSVLLTFLGASLVAYLPQEILKIGLGIFLIAYSAALLRKQNLVFPATTASAVIGGCLSGFLAGLIGTGGALRGAFLIGFNLPKEKYIATAAAAALLVDATRIPVYLGQGFLTSAYYWHLPILFVLALAGSFLGKKIVERVPREKFRIAVLIAILLVGVKFAFNF